jgi:hypothetical protein
LQLRATLLEQILHHDERLITELAPGISSDAVRQDEVLIEVVAHQTVEQYFVLE